MPTRGRRPGPGKSDQNKTNFQPLVIPVKIPSKFDSCLSDIEFDGLEGLFIEGQTNPPVDGTTVSLKINDDVIETLTTKSDGGYKFGPMDPHKEYTIAVTHDDYRFIQSDGYNFDAFELANVAIRVVGEDGREMAEVLVKLSGPNRFRSVKPLDETGVLQFDRLEPGEYYLNLEKKEYKFEPNHVELNLAGRTDIKVTGIRYQYSATFHVHFTIFSPLTFVLTYYVIGGIYNCQLLPPQNIISIHSRSIKKNV